MVDFPQQLLRGYEKFKNNLTAGEKELHLELADKGQKPQTMIISCCDSRATPERIFNAGIGELFIVRNVANLVPPYAPDGGQHGTSAAIEFAVHGLGVENIIIMGHGRCGGIQAALSEDFKPLEKGDFISKWIGMVKPLAKIVRQDKGKNEEQYQRELEYKSIINSLQNLRTFPYVAKLEKEGKLKLFGAWFDIREAELRILNNEGQFILLEA